MHEGEWWNIGGAELDEGRKMLPADHFPNF